jgi:hypothetical protein
MAVLALLQGAACFAPAPCQETPSEPGRYFSKKTYHPVPLPQFEQLKQQLPAPIHASEPGWIDVYWKAWELAFHNFYEPPPGSGFVSQFIDAAFNKNIFLWDTSFMTMFCNYGHPLVPGIGSLDNFYAKQHPDGEINREIVRATGEDYQEWVNGERSPIFSRWGFHVGDGSQQRPATVRYIGRNAPETNPVLTLDALNHPILAWAELESYRVTGDRARLETVWEPLKRYYGALRTYLLQGNGLYMTDWASMDNSPRNAWIEGGGTGVDISSEMVLFAQNLAEIARLLGKREEARKFQRDADATARQINHLMWDSQQRFYFDLTVDGKRAPVRTIAAYWTLLAGVASRQQAAALVQELRNSKTFGRRNAVPTCSAAEPGYDPRGGYWRGSVWAPTTTMVIRGLEKYGYQDLARDLALNHIRLVTEVFEKTGTIWENYAPDAAEPGKPARKDFVGWSGIGPIMYLIEYGIGLKPNAARNELHWRIPGAFPIGCERFRFNGHVASLLAEPEPERDGFGRLRIRVDSDSAFLLRVQFGGKAKTWAVAPGKQEFSMRVPAPHSQLPLTAVSVFPTLITDPLEARYTSR